QIIAAPTTSTQVICTPVSAAGPAASSMDWGPRQAARLKAVRARVAAIRAGCRLNGMDSAGFTFRRRPSRMGPWMQAAPVPAARGGTASSLARRMHWTSGPPRRLAMLNWDFLHDGDESFGMFYPRHYTLAGFADHDAA